MSDSTIARTPSVNATAMEQLRVVGLAVRREALALCAFVVLFLLIAPLVEDMSGPDGRPLVLDPADLGYLAMLLGLVAPLGVWKGERLFGESQLWSMPVDHGRHARMKVVAGWVWLMAMVAFGLASLVSSVGLAGGSAGVEEMRLLIADPAAARSGVQGSLPSVLWSTQLWQWALPFTAATAVYLAGSALLLGFRRPWLWAAGCWLALLAVGILVDNRTIPWVTKAFDSVYFAFDLFASGGSETGRTSVFLDSGERVTAWTRLPTLGGWAAATAMWLGLAGAAVWAASSRHREG